MLFFCIVNKLPTFLYEKRYSEVISYYFYYSIRILRNP